MISEFRHGLIILIALCPTLAPAQNQGQGPAPTDAHALTAFGGPPTTPTILYAPSDDDDSDLRDAISAACGGAVVDYFNTSNDTPTVATLQSYDLVLTCANFQYANAVTFGDRLAQYSDSGGRVVLGAFCTYTLGNSPPPYGSLEVYTATVRVTFG